MPKDIDKELIESFLTGNINSFDKLIIKYKDLVFNLCCKILGHYEDAEDCAQEVFIKVYKGLHKFKFKSSFKTWLYTVTVNSCKNRLSSLEFRMKKKKTSIEVEGKDGDLFKIPITDKSKSAYDKIKDSEINNEILKAIDKLVENQKILIVLRDIEEKSYEEISEITGIKMGTVKSTLCRARETLRKQLKGIIE